MLQAISGDAEFLRLLRDRKFSGSVHSVFRHAINLRNYADGNLYAIVAGRYGNIPDALVIEDAAFGFIDTEAGDDTHAGDGALLFIGDTLISFAQCRTWTGRLPVPAIGSAALLANAATLETLVAEKGTPGGMKAAIDASLIARETTRMLTEVSSALIAALAADDPQETRARAAGLIGLGPGLTPSGDDFLSGLMAVLHCSPPASQRGSYRDLAAAAIERAVKGTNAISATALKNAAAGRVPETVIALIAELCRSEPQHLAEAATRVLSIGSSSGTDMLYGICAGLRLIAQDKTA